MDCLFVWLSLCLFIYLFIYIYVSNCQSVSLFLCLCVCLSSWNHSVNRSLIITFYCGYKVFYHQWWWWFRWNTQIRMMHAWHFSHSINLVLTQLSIRSAVVVWSCHSVIFESLLLTVFKSRLNTSPFDLIRATWSGSDVLSACTSLQSYLKSVYTSAILNVLSISALTPAVIVFCIFRYDDFSSFVTKAKHQTNNKV